MATLTADRPFTQRSLLDPIEAPTPARTVPARAPEATPPRAPEAAPRTLDDLVSGTWDTLLESHTAACPVCRAALAPRWSSGAKPVGGLCRSCGAELA